MKKVYTLTGLVLIAGGAMAQLATQPLPKGLAPKTLYNKADKPYQGMAKGACVLAEDFETNSIADLLSAGWSIGPQVEQQDDNTGVGLGTFVDAWRIGTAADANDGGYLPVPDEPPGNLSAFANDDADPCNCDMTDVGLVTPSMDFTSLTAASVSLRAYSDENFGGSPATVQASSDGGTTWVDEYTVAAVDNAWQSIVVDLSAYDGLPDVKLRFHWSDGTSWATGFAVDDICVAQILPNNMAIIQVFTEDVTLDNLDPAIRSLEYTAIPLEQAEALNVGASVINNGGNSQTNVTLSAEILLDGVSQGTFNGAPIATSNPGQVDSVIIATGWTPSALGTVTVSVTVSADATDDDPSNNSDSKDMEITGPALAEGSGMWARDRDAASSFFGNGTDGYVLGNVFEVMQSGSVAYGVGIAFGTSDDGTLIHAKLLDVNLDVVEESGDHEMSPAEYNTVGENNFTYIPLQSPVSLNAPDDYVAAIENFGGGDVRVAASGVPPPQTSFFYDYTDATWYYVLATPMVRLFLGNAIGIEELSQNGVSLGANMPNPFNGNTSIQYELSDAREVSFRVVDVNGQVVFAKNYGHQGAGKHLIDFDSQSLAAGVYSYTLSAGADQLTRRMVVAK